MKCETCKGEGGFVAILEDGQEEFISCGDCDGYGFREGPTSDTDASRAGADPLSRPLSEREPFDVAREQMELADEEELRRKERS